jgi:signal transduction histidine kinase
MLLLIFQYSGTGNQFIWFYSAIIQKYITFFAGIGYFAAHVYFIRTFFNMQFKHGFTGVFIKILLVIVGLFGILPIIHLYNQSIGNQYPNINYYFINGIFFIYGFMVFILCIYTYKESKRREIVWIFVGMLLHFFNWLIFINNDFAMLKPLNFLDNWKLFDSNIFVPQLNYYITLLEFFTITIFISMNYYKLIQQNNLSSKRLEFFQKRNINTFVLGQEDEREKISNEIGNAISTDILHLKKSLLDLQFIDEKNKIPTILNDIDKTLEDIKNITSNYVAPNMQQMKLAELITTATEKIYTETNLQFNFSKMPESFQLNAVANINLYRVLQEISNNILKHASAKNVTIHTIKDSKSLQIKIIDDGVGFESFTPANKGIGLMNIESRMNSLNGNFYVLSNKQKGSTMHLIMPLKDIIE